MTGHRSVTTSTENKLDRLSEIEGEDAEQLAESAMMDGCCPGICMNDGCDQTADVEPDCATGYCETCRTNTVMSVCRLLGII